MPQRVATLSPLLWRSRALPCVPPVCPPYSVWPISHPAPISGSGQFDVLGRDPRTPAGFPGPRVELLLIGLTAAFGLSNAGSPQWPRPGKTAHPALDHMQSWPSAHTLLPTYYKDAPKRGVLAAAVVAPLPDTQWFWLSASSPLSWPLGTVGLGRPAACNTPKLLPTPHRGNHISLSPF